MTETPLSVAPETTVQPLFEVLIDQTNRIMGTERTTLFLHDPETDHLWSPAATGIQHHTIRVPAHRGICGWVFQHRKPLLINDVAGDPRFHPVIDDETGFRARSILCIPLLNRDDGCVGVLQALNKRSGDFVADDWDLFQSVSHYMVVALENAKLHEELKTMSKARERIIHHLSHEIRTPLAVISAVLGQLSRRIPDDAAPELNRIIDRGRRNVGRLVEIQKKIDDIIHDNHAAQKQQILTLIQSAADFVQELGESETPIVADVMERIHGRLTSVYPVTDDRPSEIALDAFLDRLCDEAACRMNGRNIEIQRHFESGLYLAMDETVLKKSCFGLLKNAVENTPDGGRIEVTAANGSSGVRIDVRDFGVGITPQNQKLIFGGFFHTQETHLYRSGRPYDFNAGGAGADLLRIRVFSERYGFSVDFESNRCPFIPGDTDLCPGRISDCRFISNREDCLASGGSRFSLRFCHSGNRTFPMRPGHENGQCFLCYPKN
jgi:signal transduction histidine kinase